MILVAVVPTYNEAGSVQQLIEALLPLRLPDVEMRVLVVDDASSDGTAQLVEACAQRAPGRVELLRRDAKRGLGSAYVAGFSRALAGGADLIAQMDADLSHDPAALAAMTEAIRDADLVLASRYLPGGGVDTEWGWHRKLVSGLANGFVVPRLLSCPVTDATSGYRLWRRDALARIAPSISVRSNGYGFQVEMACLAHHLGCRIKEVPIYFRERTTGRSKMNVREAFGAVRDILAIRHRWAAPAVGLAGRNERQRRT
ncbi:MAG: polyprenol monophosphomannose synthase [bacterium]